MTRDEDVEKIRKRLFSILVGYEVGSYKDNIDEFYKDLCDVYKELYELTMMKPDRCVKCDTEIPKGCIYCQSCIDEIRDDLNLIDEAKELEDLEKRANEWIKSQGYNEENLPNDEYVQMKDAFIAGARDYRYMSVVCESTLHY